MKDWQVFILCCMFVFLLTGIWMAHIYSEDVEPAKEENTRIYQFSMEHVDSVFVVDGVLRIKMRGR